MCSHGYKTLKAESISERKLFFFPFISPPPFYFFIFLNKKGGKYLSNWGQRKNYWEGDLLIMWDGSVFMNPAGLSEHCSNLGAGGLFL